MGILSGAAREALVKGVLRLRLYFVARSRILAQDDKIFGNKF
jgi:hypothetical protein